MFDLDTWLLALAAVMAFGIAGWIVSLIRRDVSIVDSMWSIMFLIAAIIYAYLGDIGPRRTGTPKARRTPCPRPRAGP